MNVWSAVERLDWLWEIRVGICSFKQKFRSASLNFALDLSKRIRFQRPSLSAVSVSLSYVSPSDRFRLASPVEYLDVCTNFRFLVMLRTSLARNQSMEANRLSVLLIPVDTYFAGANY